MAETTPESVDQEKNINSDLWEFSGKYVGCCAMCGREGLKRNMYTLSIRKPRSYSAPRTLCHVCPACIPALLKGLDASVPE